MMRTASAVEEEVERKGQQQREMEASPTSCTIDIVHQMAVVAKTTDTAGSARKRSMLINLDTFVMFPVCFLTTSATQCRRYFGISEYELIMPNA